jgi:hypothetical protein
MRAGPSPMTSADISRREDEESPVANVPAIDLTSVIARTIESVRDDPSQLRNAIYELARVKLQKEAWASNMSLLSARRLMLALETAIERVETVASQQDEFLRYQSESRLGVDPASDLYLPLPDHAPSNDVYRLSVFDQKVDAALLPAASNPPSLHPSQWRLRDLALPLRIGILSIATLVAIFFVGRHFDLFEKTAKTLAKKGDIEKAITKPAPPPPPEIQTHSAQVPLPSVYGVYALSNDRLFELEALAGKVPDPRVHISALLRTPSHTILPDGRITFIVYRRDIAVNAPDRVQVRIIAKVMRAMNFNTGGRTNVVSVDNEWNIRSNSYELRVAPVSGTTEMLMVRPDKSDFVFPAGRYGLVLKGQAYDFTVAGPITEAVQCLERTAAANGEFYSECRSP